MGKHFAGIDLHMHSTVSDGTDTPEELLIRVRETGLTLFSVTDHDAVKGGCVIQSLLTAEEPDFLTGVEFSCKDDEGKYHILGYGFDPEAEPIRQVIETGHGYRMEKVQARLDFLKTRFGIVFPNRDVLELISQDNPGKPHIGNLMVKHRYCQTMDEAIKKYLDQIHFPNKYIRPETAIRGIVESGGIPVLAHPCYGSGDELILGAELEDRVRRLMEFGLRGLEAYYSGFSEKLRAQVLRLADRCGLVVTAGSDYHGTNKLIQLGDTGLEEERARVIDGFLKEIKYSAHTSI